MLNDLAALAQSKNVSVDQVPTITCPESLDATVGATTTCELQDATTGDTYDVAVKITGLDGESAKFSVEVAASPRP